MLFDSVALVYNTEFHGESTQTIVRAGTEEFCEPEKKLSCDVIVSINNGIRKDAHAEYISNEEVNFAILHNIQISVTCGGIFYHFVH